MDSTLALGALRIARGAGGEAVREREPRRAGEASPKPPPKPPPKPRSGLCPELLADFRIPNLLGARRGAEGSFLCSLITDFLAEGAGWGAPPGRGGELGCLGAAGAKKKSVRLASVFPSPPFRSSDFAGPRRPRLYGFHTGTRSLANRKGRGRRRGGREREPRRAGEGR